jgi:hypothetical protein
MAALSRRARSSGTSVAGGGSEVRSVRMRRQYASEEQKGRIGLFGHGWVFMVRILG